MWKHEGKTYKEQCFEWGLLNSHPSQRKETGVSDGLLAWNASWVFCLSIWHSPGVLSGDHAPSDKPRIWLRTCERKQFQELELLAPETPCAESSFQGALQRGWDGLRSPYFLSVCITYCFITLAVRIACEKSGQYNKQLGYKVNIWNKQALHSRKSNSYSRFRNPWFFFDECTYL